MSVVRFFARIFFGFLAVVGGLAVLLLAAGLLLWQLLPAPDRRIPPEAVLLLDLGDGLAEARPESALARASLGDTLVLREVVLALEAAERDRRVRGVVARLGRGPLGMAQAQELRDAIADFRGSGKFALAFAETFGEGGNGDLHYYLATAFDEIWLQPSGDVGLTGVLLQVPFLEEALAELGIAPRLDQRHEYKAAADTFLRRAMPDPVRANLQRLADSWVEQIAAGIAEGRPIDILQARALIDRGPFLAEAAQTAGLVDRLAYWDEIEAAVAARGGEEGEIVPFGRYIAALPGPPADAPVIALIYGLGPVQLGGDERTLAGGVVMASDKVAQALSDAAADEEVAAILFRIDSPGGSYVASDAIWREVDRARRAGKPVVVSMANTAASGGYFAAAAAEMIVAQPATVTGSIGVFGGKFVLSDLWDRLGIAWEGVQAGLNADYGSINHDYTEAGWAHLQASLDRIYADFTAKVAAGRDMPLERVHEVARGQIWSGADARQRGLVDELGGFKTAIRLARSAAGIEPGAAVRLEQFPEPPSPLRELIESLAGGRYVGAELGRLAAALQRLAEIAGPLRRAASILGGEPPAPLLAPPPIGNIPQNSAPPLLE